MTSSPELPVPDAAVDAFTATDPMAYGDTATMVRAIAGPVVAAVLREEAERLDVSASRLADALAVGADADPWTRGARAAATRLRARADQLDLPVSSR